MGTGCHLAALLRSSVQTVLGREASRVGTAVRCVGPEHDTARQAVSTAHFSSCDSSSRGMGFIYSGILESYDEINQSFF